MTALLEIRNLKAEIAGKQILNGYDLTVNAGEVHAIMGPNGSGKSTLSYVLSGRPGYKITEGQALLDGAATLPDALRDAGTQAEIARRRMVEAASSALAEGEVVEGREVEARRRAHAAQLAKIRLAAFGSLGMYEVRDRDDGRIERSLRLVHRGLEARDLILETPPFLGVRLALGAR